MKRLFICLSLLSIIFFTAHTDFYYSSKLERINKIENSPPDNEEEPGPYHDKIYFN